MTTPVAARCSIHPALYARLPHPPEEDDKDWRGVRDGPAEDCNVTVAHRDDGRVDVF